METQTNLDRWTREHEQRTTNKLSTNQRSSEHRIANNIFTCTKSITFSFVFFFFHVYQIKESTKPCTFWLWPMHAPPFSFFHVIYGNSSLLFRVWPFPLFYSNASLFSPFISFLKKHACKQQRIGQGEAGSLTGLVESEEEAWGATPCFHLFWKLYIYVIAYKNNLAYWYSVQKSFSKTV